MAAFRIFPPPLLPSWVAQGTLARSTPSINDAGRTISRVELAPSVAHSTYELYATLDLKSGMPSRADTAIACHDLPAALALLNDVIASHRGSRLRLALYYNRQAFLLYRIGRLNDAEEAIEMVMRIFEREGLEARPADYYERSVIRYKKRNLHGAFEDIQTAIRHLKMKRIDVPPNYLFHQALLLSNLQDYRNAREAILFAIAATPDPDRVPARHFSLAAKIFRNMNRLRLALEMIDQAIRQERGRPFAETHFEKSRILVAQRRYREALVEVELTLMMEPEKGLVKTLRHKAYILSRLGRWHEAEAILADVLQRAGNRPDRQTLKEWQHVRGKIAERASRATRPKRNRS